VAGNQFPATPNSLNCGSGPRVFLGRLRLKLKPHHGLIADNPGIMARFDDVRLAGGNRERRDVDLVSDVVELLSGFHDGRANDDLVFPGASCQGFMSPTVVLRRHLYPAMRSAQIERVGPTQEKRTFHSFRHMFAKRALESGAQITWLSRHLGHSSLKVTTDIYGHWERAERKLQAAKMEDAFPV
jgi:integrase